MLLKFTLDTYFKALPKQSDELSDSEKVFAHARTEYKLHSYGEEVAQHIKVALLDKGLGSKNTNTWYVFSDAVEIEDDERDPNTDTSEDTPELESAIKTGGFKLPGFTSTFYLSDPIISGGNFTWSEATKGGNRIPKVINHSNSKLAVTLEEAEKAVNQIIMIATRLEDVRRTFDNRSIKINSWYRPPHINKSVGGVSDSRHITGDGVDIVVDGIRAWDVHDKLNPIWRGGLGKARSFTHLDCRATNTRWLYSNK